MGKVVIYFIDVLICRIYGVVFLSGNNVGFNQLDFFFELLYFYFYEICLYFKFVYFMVN